MKLMKARDLALAFDNGEFAHLYRQDWVMTMIKEARSNRDFEDSRTQQVARWAREHVKQQINKAQNA